VRRRGTFEEQEEKEKSLKARSKRGRRVREDEKRLRLMRWR
jgi:hypothetical protein